jgi:hypothetical protein
MDDDDVASSGVLLQLQSTRHRVTVAGSLGHFERMDKNERRRLKKLGKERAEQRSQEVHAALAAANPAPIGSDQWGANYRKQILQERELRTTPPDYIPSSVAQRDWVTLATDDSSATGVFPIPTHYLHCGRCGDLIHSVADSSIRCKCGNIQIQPNEKKIFVGDRSAIRLVTLLAKVQQK